MERELARAVLLEMIYRTQRGILAGQDYVEPPPWLIYGLLADRPHRDTTPLREALYVHGPFKSVGDFLNQRPELLDPSARLLYRAYSFAFVRWLIERGDGRARLARYIDNLASASNNGASDLRETFPELPPNGEEKWIGDVAEVARETQILSFSRSEEQLRELLAQPGTVRAEAESTRLDELCEKKLTRSQQPALQKLVKDLILLSERANPLLRPIVQRYQAIAVQLTLGKKRGAGAELRQLRDLRARLSARMSEVDDYLNWFEATQLNTASGLFEHDLESSEELKATSYRKKDALSLYLNAVEQEN
jgi:hypothetical protein